MHGGGAFMACRRGLSVCWLLTAVCFQLDDKNCLSVVGALLGRVRLQLCMCVI